MYKQIAILVLLLVAASGQTCSATTLSNIASKTLTLAVGSNGFTQREYVETLAGSLGISSTIHQAFGTHSSLFSHRWFPSFMHPNRILTWSRYCYSRKLKYQNEVHHELRPSRWFSKPYSDSMDKS